MLLQELKLKENRVYVWSFILLLCASFFSVGFYHPDEHYQLLEFAGLKLHLTEAIHLPWEYHESIRPTFQPFLVIGIYKFFNLFSTPSPFVIALILRILSAVLAFYTMLKLYWFFAPKFHNEQLLAWLKILSFFSWFLIFNSVRFSSENWSGSFFIIAFVSCFQLKQPSFWKYIGIGCLFGISFLFRYQALFLIGGFIGWLFFIQKESFKVFSGLIIGLICMMLVGVLIDTWFYGKFTLSFWNYFTQNILHNRAQDYGVESWYFYFKQVFEKGIPPFSVFYIISIILFFLYKWKNVLTWCLIPFLGIHFFIGHKELRFFFPIFCFLPYILIEAIKIVNAKFQLDLTKKKVFLVCMKIFIIVNIGFSIIVAFRPMTTKVYLYSFLYSTYQQPTTLYYLDKNPYETIFFYRNKNLRIVQVSDLESINVISKNDKGNHLVVVNPENKLPNFIKRSKKVFATFPPWLYNFNIKNWMAKSESYTIYEIKK